MKTLLFISMTAITLCFPTINNAQPDLGAASTFAVFTGNGAFTNTGATFITGDIGTNVGFFDFTGGTVIGNIHVADPTSSAAATAVGLAYAELFSMGCDEVIGVTLGNGQIVTPGVYCQGAASTINGTLVLDGQNDPNALFVFQIGGALSTSTLSSVVLINGASLCNVWWQVNGAFALGEGSVFRGNLLANGAISLLEGSSLIGRALATVGAIDLHANLVTIGLPPVASVITASASTDLCIGDSVILSGNVDGTWSTGAVTPTITVTTSGDFYVVNTTVCGSDTSNHILVTVNALPLCTITGDIDICEGQSTELCATAGMASYLWSNGEITSCITVSTEGTYSVTITDANGCSSTCSTTVIVNPVSACTITGDASLCIGQTTELCVAAGAASYLWSTGEITNCITVSTTGLFSVTVTTADGCISICSQTVTLSAVPLCLISGPDSICEGQSTELCALIGYESYLWSTGATTNCLTVSAAGTYTVTVTHANGCTSTCSQTITISTPPICLITGEAVICEGQSTDLCVMLAPGVSLTDYWWETGDQTQCITVTTAGTYFVTITDEAGCTSVCSFTVTVNPVPICTIIGADEICEGQSTELCATASASAYLWSTGAISACITVSTAGTYSVTITDTNGCTSVCSHFVIVSTQPVCTITGDLSICLGLSTELCVPPGALSYLWSTGASTNCITVSVAGTYSVTMTDVTGCVSVCSETVTVNALPVCGITGNNFICQVGQTTELCATAGASIYLWSTGAITACITVSLPGLYSVTITDANGCISVCSETVTVTPLPVCTITGDVSLCLGQSTDLCVPAGALSYLWSTGATTNCITVNVAGIFAVTVTTADGCISTCNTVVTLTTPPPCLITGDVSICLGLSTELCVPAGASSYLWSTGAITNCITVSTAGLFSVTITDLDGCISTCSTTVTVNPLPLCTITGDDVICLGQSTELCVTPGASAYLWSTGATINCITVLVAGTYSVTVTDINGCTSVCSEIVTVNPLPLCLITGDNLLCLGESTELCVSAGASAYLWSNGAITNCVTVNAAGIYSVTVTDANGCTSICSTTVTLSPLPVCSITGADIGCEGQSTELCAFPGGLSYLWNTGATTNCISVILAGTYLVTVTDANGCSSICSHLVIINPNAPPAITCPEDMTIDCDDSTLPANTGNATATGTCSLIPTITFADVVSPGSCPQEFTITRTWTASYGDGVSSICVQLIVIEDINPPVIVCPPDVTIECDESTLPSNTGTATASDICSLISTISFTDVLSDGDCPLGSTITRTWLATDECGNTATCDQVITTNDNTPPVITLVNPLLAANGDTTYVQCYGQDPLWDLPVFDESSVVATDICEGEVTVDYSQVLLAEGDCEEDGFIILYRLTWTATDECGNSSSAFVFLALVDTIAPIIYGVPGDTTVNCTDIPALPVLVYATDECLCACIVLVQESILPEGCLNGGVLIRTWTARDRCGNETVVTQRITIVDDRGPVLFVVEPDMAGMTDGAVLEYACSEGGMPFFFDLLDEESVAGVGLCGGSALVTFSVTTIDALNCEFYGYMEQQTYQWTAVDECGNVATFTLIARLVDDVAPVLIGVPEIACIADAELRNIYAIDNCEEAYTQFWDVTIPNPCGTGTAILRTYEAYDDCGNSTRASVILMPNDITAPTMEFVDPAMNDLDVGEIMVINCFAGRGRYTAFSVDDVLVTGPCTEGVTLEFQETLISNEDCLAGEVVAVIELKWTATDICGNVSEHVIIAHVVDDSSPVFVGFAAEMTIGCNDAMPAIFARDNCGDVVIATQDSIVQGDCVSEYDIYRVITATDACGNKTTRQQLVHVGGSGPVISGVLQEICDDLNIPVVTAYDACAEEFVAVTMTQDTLDVLCRDGLVIQRTWTAVDACGNVTVIHQTIVMDDQTPPEILIPSASVINHILEHGIDLMHFSQTDLIKLINALDEFSVIVIDECDQYILPVLTVDILIGDCNEDGYSERRTYTWVATDVCGNSSSVSVTVDIMDDVPPTMIEITSDTTIICVELPAPPDMLLDPLDGGTVTYTQVILPGNNPNEFFVTRTWVATDSCGNATVVYQRITWIPDTYLVCEVLLPESVECNSHGIIIGSIVTGGFGGYTYDWIVEGEKCFIQGGQNTPQIEIYVGWGDVKIILNVTDSFGCVSMCMIVLSCDLTETPLGSLQETLIPQANSEYSTSAIDLNLDTQTGEYLSLLNLWPNPTTGSITLSFESAIEQEIEFTLTNYLGQEVLREQFTAVKGQNIRKMSLEHFPTGSYLLQAQTETEVQTQVIIIIPNK